MPALGSSLLTYSRKSAIKKRNFSGAAKDSCKWIMLNDNYLTAIQSNGLRVPVREEPGRDKIFLW
jgi:hypothetical protein